MILNEYKLATNKYSLDELNIELRRIKNITWQQNHTVVKKKIKHLNKLIKNLTV